MSQPQSPEYSAALTAAAIAVREAAAPAPVDVIGQIIDNVAASTDEVGQQVTARIQRAFLRINPYVGAEVQAFIRDAARQMRAAQTAVSTLVAGGQRAQFRTAGLDVPSLAMSNPTEVRGPEVTLRPNGSAVVARPNALTVTYLDEATPDARVTEEDYSTEGIFNRPVRTYRYERSIGTPESEARQRALVKVEELVDDNLMLTQRVAEHEALAQVADLDNRVIGYRRVIHPELSRGGVCGMCIAAADRLYRVRDLKAIHNRCKCTVSAVTKDFDPGDHLNKADLGTLYRNAGNSTANANLKRVRYQVDEHGELGAVLVPKRRKKKASPPASRKRSATTASA